MNAIEPITGQAVLRLTTPSPEAGPLVCRSSAGQMALSEAEQALCRAPAFRAFFYDAALRQALGQEPSRLQLAFLLSPQEQADPGFLPIAAPLLRKLCGSLFALSVDGQFAGYHCCGFREAPLLLWDRWKQPEDRLFDGCLHAARQMGEQALAGSRFYSLHTQGQGDALHPFFQRALAQSRQWECFVGFPLPGLLAKELLQQPWLPELARRGQCILLGEESRGGDTMLQCIYLMVNRKHSSLPMKTI